MKKQPKTKINQLKLGTTLDKYADTILFPEKVAKATDFVKNIKESNLTSGSKEQKRDQE